MKIGRLLPLLCAAAVFFAGGCKKTPAPPQSHTEVAQRWWRAVAAGDAAGAASCVSGEPAQRQSSLVIDEYARIAKAAGEGDRLASGMLERLQGVRIGEVRSGSEMAVVPLLLGSGKPFLSVILELRDGRWVITDIRQDDGGRR